jgi:hypothetical protein
MGRLEHPAQLSLIGKPDTHVEHEIARLAACTVGMRPMPMESTLTRSRSEGHRGPMESFEPVFENSKFGTQEVTWETVDKAFGRPAIHRKPVHLHAPKRQERHYESVRDQSA